MFRSRERQIEVTDLPLNDVCQFSKLETTENFEHPHALKWLLLFVCESATNSKKIDVPYWLGKGYYTKWHKHSCARQQRKLCSQWMRSLFLISFVLLIGQFVEGAPQANNIFKVPMGGTVSDCSLSLWQRVPELEEDYEAITGTDQVQAFRSQQYHTWVFFNEGSVVHAILPREM